MTSPRSRASPARSGPAKVRCPRVGVTLGAAALRDTSRIPDGARLDGGLTETARSGASALRQGDASRPWSAEESRGAVAGMALRAAGPGTFLALDRGEARMLTERILVPVDG